MKPGETMAYVPESGDIVWIAFNPQAGHEQAGHRPALVLSPKVYNGKVGLALFCPITSQVKGYPFEVLMPEGLEVQGAILSDQVKSLDWKARKARFSCKLPPEKFNEVIKKLNTLIREQPQST
jgi:mRNA interferase MazF